jgi:hypothetical protein
MTNLKLKEPDEIEVIDIEEYTKEGKPIPRHVKYYLIKINNKKYRVESPITEEEILAIAELAPCSHSVKQVFRGKEPVILEPDVSVDLTEPGIEHFIIIPVHELKIIINGRQKSVDKKKISFDEVVRLAFDTPPDGENICFTITYHNGPRPNPEGTMVEGNIVKLKCGMVFNVTATDKS